MSKQMTIAIAGLGSRGRDTYAKAATIYPDKMKIVAIADIDPEKVKLTAREYDIPESRCYTSAEDMLKEDKLADAMIIATQDRQHVEQAIVALKKGYHLLLEKPISPDLEECRKISEVAKECKREVVVCHVLRYTPIYQKVKEILDAGTIGDVISIMAIENVGWLCNCCEKSGSRKLADCNRTYCSQYYGTDNRSSQSWCCKCNLNGIFS